MPLFVYQALDSTGKRVSGELEASDRRKLVSTLKQRGLTPISIQAKAQDAKVSQAAESTDFFKKANSGKQSSFFRVNRSKSTITLQFLKRLLVLLTSGMSLGDAVNLLNKRLSDPQLKQLSQDIWKDLSEGKTLATAMRASKGMFSESTIHLVEAGESSGNLVVILERIVAYLEESRDVRKRLLNSLSYPALVMSVAFVVVIIMLTFLLPRIQLMLDQLGGELPWITKALLAGSDLATQFGPFILVAIGVLIFGIFSWRKTSQGKYKTDFWILSSPLIGKIYLYSNIYATSNLMSTLLSSGINTTETLRLVERTISNVILRGKFGLARKQIQEGVSMATAIHRVHYMPDLAMDILNVGENTGNIVTSLNDINKMYREELTRSLNGLTNSVVAIALISAITLVAIIAVSVVFSILSVSQSIQL